MYSLLTRLLVNDASYWVYLALSSHLVNIAHFRFRKTMVMIQIYVRNLTTLYWTKATFTVSVKYSADFVLLITVFES